MRTVAVRMPAHPVAQAILEAFGGPLVAPSANRFGRISPTRPEHVRAELEGRIEAVVDGGPCRLGLESTIVALEGDGAGRPRLLRPGAVPREVLESVVGPLEVAPPRGPIEAPGQVTVHYAPGTPARMLPGPLDTLSADELGAFCAPHDAVGLLRVVGPEPPARQRLEAAGLRVVAVHTLSSSGDLAQAAQALFATLRRLDDGPATILLVEPCPTHEGLGHAIQDRLRRATARS